MTETVFGGRARATGSVISTAAQVTIQHATVDPAASGAPSNRYQQAHCVLGTVVNESSAAARERQLGNARIFGDGCEQLIELYCVT